MSVWEHVFNDFHKEQWPFSPFFFVGLRLCLKIIFFDFLWFNWRASGHCLTSSCWKNYLQSLRSNLTGTRSRSRSWSASSSFNHAASWVPRAATELVTTSTGIHIRVLKDVVVMLKIVFPEDLFSIRQSNANSFENCLLK